jgi:hypothetical protein
MKRSCSLSMRHFIKVCHRMLLGGIDIVDMCDCILPVCSRTFVLIENMCGILPPKYILDVVEITQFKFIFLVLSNVSISI